MAAPVELRKPEFTTVDHLRPDTTGHNLVVKVIESKVVHSRTAAPGGGRQGQQPGRVAECLVGDETGVILLTARNEQVETCAAGAYCTLRNAKVDMFRGSMRLVVDQWGALEPASGSHFTPKADYNLSLVEYELVTVMAAGSSTAANPRPSPAEAEHTADAQAPAAAQAPAGDDTHV